MSDFSYLKKWADVTTALAMAACAANSADLSGTKLAAGSSSRYQVATLRLKDSTQLGGVHQLVLRHDRAFNRQDLHHSH